MVTLDHTALRIRGALDIAHVRTLELHVGVNCHGWAKVEGEAGEAAFEQLRGAVAGRELNLITEDEEGVERTLFAGVIREAELVRVGGLDHFCVELVSGTSLMDREKKKRSFQAVEQTYSQVAEEVASGYAGGAVICSVGEEQRLEQPVIQYRETDWEFLMRMASHCGGVVVPEVSQGLPRLWFGFPERSYTCSFPEDSYRSGISGRYYELGGAAAGYSRGDFLYYDVESSQLCDLGWYTKFKGQSFIISEKHGRLERGELIFTYRLGRPGLGWARRLENEKISGMSLQGEVTGTSGETVTLKLDIDQGRDPGGPYPYPWRPETGNLMYCMPQVGTRVALYFPGMDEKQAMATSCVRTNGGSCAGMSDPSMRGLLTEHGKELLLHPTELGFKSAGGSMLLSDETGISLTTPGAFTLVGSSVRFESPIVNCAAPTGEIVMAKADPTVEQPEPESSYSQSGAYDLASATAELEGSNIQELPEILDAPQEAPPFDWGGLVGNVLGGIAIALCVGALVAMSILFFPVVIAAATGAAVATGTMVAAGVIGGLTAAAGVAATAVTAAEDIESGCVRDASVYINNSYNVSVTVGSVLQMAYGIYNLGSFVKGLPNILSNISKFLSSGGGSGTGGLMPAFAGIGPGGSSVVGGAVTVEGVLTGAQALEGLQGLSQLLIGKNIFEASTTGGSGGSGGGMETKPSKELGGEPRGEYSTQKGRGIQRQNEAAKQLAENGYDVEMLPEKPGGNGYGVKPTSNPDYLIENKAFDCYSPDEDTLIRTIVNTLRRKTSDQAERIILNLADVPPETIGELKDAIFNKLSGDLKHLLELKAILPNGDIVTWFVR